jgi:hypothetical protein
VLCELYSKDKQARTIKAKEQVGRKYKEQEKDLKGIPLWTWVSVSCECCVLFWPLSLSIRAVGKNHPVMLLHSKKYFCRIFSYQAYPYYVLISAVCFGLVCRL